MAKESAGMKKLSQEQAEALVEILNNLPQYAIRSRADNLPDIAIRTVEALQAINQCTEKEFPAFELRWVGHEGNELELSKSWCDKCKIRVGDDRNSWHLNCEQFKAFSEGCFKITQWLDEQE